VSYANNLDPDETPSISASQLNPSCLTHFHKFRATLKHFEIWSRREIENDNIFGGLRTKALPLFWYCSTIAERLRVRRSSVELTLNVYPGDLLVQEHHKKLIKRNTISDFYSNRNGSTTNLNEGSIAFVCLFALRSLFLGLQYWF